MAKGLHRPGFWFHSPSASSAALHLLKTESVHFTNTEKLLEEGGGGQRRWGGVEEARKKNSRQEIKAFYSVSLSYSNCAKGSVKVRSKLVQEGF